MYLILVQIAAETDLESVRRRIAGVPADAAKRYIIEMFPGVVKKARYLEMAKWAQQNSKLIHMYWTCNQIFLCRTSTVIDNFKVLHSTATSLWRLWTTSPAT